MSEQVNMLTVLGAAGLTVGLLVLLRRLFKQRAVSLQGKVVLLTGASSGLGEACAHVFYRAGAKLILCARRTEELERVKKDLQSLKTVLFEDTPTFEPHVLPLDVGDFDSLASKVETAVGFHGRIDVLLNNAGISCRGSVLETLLEVDQRVMNVNYFGTAALTKVVLPHMIKQKSGHILVVSSIQGHIGIPFRSAYAASKHAVQAFCDSLRAEVAESNIEVSVYSPSYIRTNLSLNALTEAGQQHGVMEQTLDTGMSAEYAAQGIMRCVTHRQQDVLVGPLLHRMAVYGRLLIPTVFFKVMAARAAKERQQEKKDK